MKRRSTKARTLLVNAAKTTAGMLRSDPTRTSGLRNQFCRMIEAQFDKLKVEVLRAVGKENWLGVEEPTENVLYRIQRIGGKFEKVVDGDDFVCGATVPKLLGEDKDLWNEEYRKGYVGNRSNIYQPFVCNGQTGWFPFNAEQGLIEIPDVRQPDGASCGAAAAMSLGMYYGVGPDSVLQWRADLGTHEVDGTHPSSIVAYLRHLGLQVEAFRHGNLDTLDGYLGKGWPVVCCVQDYGPKHSKEHGHYLVVIGRKDGYVFAQDPAMDNVMTDGHHEPISELGSLHKPGRVMIPEEDFIQAWHDEDAGGVPFVRFGIAVGPKVVANSNPNHDEQGRFAAASGWRDLLVPTGGDPELVEVAVNQPGGVLLRLLRDKNTGYEGPGYGRGLVDENDHVYVWPEIDYLEHEDGAKALGIKLSTSIRFGIRATGNKLVVEWVARGDNDRSEKTKPANVSMQKLLQAKYDKDLGLTANCQAGQLRGTDGRCGPKAQFVENSNPYHDQRGRFTEAYPFHSGTGYVGQNNLRKAAASMDFQSFMHKYSAETTDQHELSGNKPADVIHDKIYVSKLQPSEIYDESDLKDSPYVKHIAEGLRKGKEVHPVLVEGLDNGTSGREVLDGYHRVTGVILARRHTIPVVYSIETLVRLWKSTRPKTTTSIEELTDAYLKTVQHPTNNTRWSFHSSSQKLAAFGRWIKTRIVGLITGTTQRQMWDRYIEQGWRRGASRSYDDFHRRHSPSPIESADFHRGGREQFLRSSFNNRESVEKVKLLAARVYTDLENVTQAMSAKMSRTLTDGLTMGQHPHKIAAQLALDVDKIGKRRAVLIARTELIRAHAEGQLDNLESLGVEDVGAAVEWDTAGDAKVCPLCRPMEDVVLKIRDARGLIPFHPECRCAWTPSFDKPTSKAQVNELLDESGLV